MVEYYDVILGAVGSLLVAGAMAFTVFGPQAIVAASVIAVAMVGHAMFVRPPTDAVKETASQVQPIADD